MRNKNVGLDDLKRLHQALKTSRLSSTKATSQTSSSAAAPVRPVEDGSVTFQRLTKSLTPIKQTGRREPSSPRAQREREDAERTGRILTSTAIAMRRAAAVGETDRRADAGFSDGTEVTHLLSEGGTAYVRAEAAPDTARNLRRGQWRTGAELDLHGLRVEQARHAVLSFLDECTEHGIRCVRIVHGKGYGSQGLEPVLKDKVRTWLVQKVDVMAFSEAPEREGGSGALLVLLRHNATTEANQQRR